VIRTAGLRLRAAPEAVINGTGSGCGILVDGVSGAEISGFTIQGFDSGIVINNATGSLIHRNEIRDNVYLGSSTPGYARAQDILLIGASSNEITQNSIHDNGHLGIGLFNGSSGNTIRANRLTDNQAQGSTYASFSCSLMLWGTTNRDNQIAENEVTGSAGHGIMIGPGIQTGNHVAQNRVHGHPLRGIVAMPGSSANVIEQNNAIGNGLSGGPDLWDSNTTNLWQRNLGTCTPGNTACN
jgi:parallel beta-helix repeat protein